MFEKLQELEKKYNELTNKLSCSDVLNNPQELQKTAKLHSEIEEIVSKFREYKILCDEIENTKTLLQEKEEEIKLLAKAELEELTKKSEALREELKILLLPKDPRDDKDVIMEIRAGTGGEEAALFAQELLRMYVRYSEQKNWKYEIVSLNSTDLGGLKEIIFEIKGKGAYSKLKFESGVHRVQRVPITESSGRLHTSAATVAVLVSADEVDVEIKPEDLKIEAFRASGAGGQHVNKTSSAIRITHIPTGLVVSCQDERSQHQNKEKALRILRSKLLDAEQKKKEEQIAKTRKMQIKTGDRSEKIRTYNYPQDRVTDHRIGLTVYNLKSILDGNIEEIIEKLIYNEQQEKLKEVIE